jgi:hypothetical protein
MDYKSTFTITSEYDPSIEYDLYKPSYDRRLKFDMETAQAREKSRELSKRHKELEGELREVEAEFEESKAEEKTRIQALIDNAPDADTAARHIAELEKLTRETAPVDEDTLNKLEKMNEEARIIYAFDFNPKRVRWGLAAVRGLKINGKEADVELLIAEGPTDLFNEVLHKIEEINGLSSEQLKNSLLPTTSARVEQGSDRNTIAPSASDNESTAVETAER